MTGDESCDDIVLEDRWWLNGSWNVYLASPQISQGQVTLSPICQRHSLLHSRSFCLHAMLTPHKRLLRTEPHSFREVTVP